MKTEARQKWDAEMDERRKKVVALLKSDITYKPGTINKTSGRMTCMAYNDVRTIEDALDILTDFQWTSEVRAVPGATFICIARITVPAPPDSPFPFIFHEDVGLNDNDEKGKTKASTVAKGTSSDAKKRAAFAVDACMRISYEYPKLYLQCKKGANGEWEGLPPWDFEDWWKAEIKKKPGMAPTQKTTTGTTAAAKTTTTVVAPPAPVTQPAPVAQPAPVQSPAPVTEQPKEPAPVKPMKVGEFWNHVNDYCNKKGVTLHSMREQINAFKMTPEGAAMSWEQLQKRFLSE